MQDPVSPPPADAAPSPLDAAPDQPLAADTPVNDPAPDPAPDQAADSEPATAAKAGEAAAPSPPTAPTMGPAACAQALAQHFPALFGADQPPRPLKLRIQADIQQRAPGVFSRKAMGLFFSRHTTTTAYLKALLASTTRFDLDGQPAGDIADEHRLAAQEELNRRRDLVQQRRAAHRPPRGPGGPGRPGQTGGPPPQESAMATATAAADGQAAPGGADQPTAPPSRPSRRDDRGPRRPQDPNAAAQPRRPDPRRDDRRGPPPAGAPRDARPNGPSNRQQPRRPDQQADRQADGRPAGRPEGRPDGRPGGRPDHRQEPRRDPRPDHRPNPAARGDADGAPALPSDPAQRDRAVLLRQFETSPLSKANFCALKGLKEADLDATLAQARQERGERPGPATRPAGAKP